MNTFELSFQFTGGLFLRARHFPLFIFRLLGKVMAIGTFAAGLGTHRAAGEIKNNRESEKEKQGLLVHVVFKSTTRARWRPLTERRIN